MCGAAAPGAPVTVNRTGLWATNYGGALTINSDGGGKTIPAFLENVWPVEKKPISSLRTGEGSHEDTKARRGREGTLFFSTVQ